MKTALLLLFSCTALQAGWCCWKDPEQPKQIYKKAPLSNDIHTYHEAVKNLKTSKTDQAFEKFKLLGFERQKLFLQQYFALAAKPEFCGLGITQLQQIRDACYFLKAKMMEIQLSDPWHIYLLQRTQQPSSNLS